ncbi:MAG: hypothetical protein LQ348_004040 [Seirophora lacunosa]|nr:MAG: hypothetical protein LQ348_004040 [Seirophora lacunosa]
MFGPFKSTSPLSSGLLWKIPWRLSSMQKARQRKRLRAVDNVVACVDTALRKQGSSMKEIERWKTEMPREEEMRPKDKYTIFDRKEKRSKEDEGRFGSTNGEYETERALADECVDAELPKWTRVSQRINPPGF